MAFVHGQTNYASTTLRASAITTGAAEQDAAKTLPDTVNEIWVVFEKTTENNIDNLLTVRLQARVDSTWFDVSWDSITTSAVITVAADVVANVTRTPNIEDASSDPPTYQIVAHYKALPSNVVRIISISSGTGVTHTFEVIAYYQQNQL